jgi:periplasmic divalent cation tolerance protein
MAAMLVERHLAACVQVIPGVTSYFSWHNRLTSDPEYLLLIKTVTKRFTEVRDAILEAHPL